MRQCRTTAGQLALERHLATCHIGCEPICLVRHITTLHCLYLIMVNLWQLVQGPDLGVDLKETWSLHLAWFRVLKVHHWCRRVVLSKVQVHVVIEEVFTVPHVFLADSARNYSQNCTFWKLPQNSAWNFQLPCGILPLFPFWEPHGRNPHGLRGIPSKFSGILWNSAHSWQIFLFGLPDEYN